MIDEGVIIETINKCKNMLFKNKEFLQQLCKFKEEWCGYIEFKNGEFNETNANIRYEQGTLLDNRNICYTKENIYNITWHTHPIRSKFYPSAEDIVKFLKKPNKLHFLITFKYIWSIIYLGPIITTEKEVDKINKINDILYNHYYKNKSKSKRDYIYNNNIISEQIIKDYIIIIESLYPGLILIFDNF